MCACVEGQSERASGTERVSLWKTRREGDELGAKFRRGTFFLCLALVQSHFSTELGALLLLFFPFYLYITWLQRFCFLVRVFSTCRYGGKHVMSCHIEQNTLLRLPLKSFSEKLFWLCSLQLLMQELHGCTVAARAAANNLCNVWKVINVTAS